MKLPLTDEEFTQFALAHSSTETSLLARTLDKKEFSDEGSSARMRGRIVEWVRCIAHFRPDLVKFEYTESRHPGTKIIVANVWIATTKNPVRTINEYLGRLSNEQ